MHVLVAAYVRTVAARPAINRFISGQKIFARHDIETIMAIKMSMTLDAPDTMIKLKFAPTATAEDVYHAFVKEIDAKYAAKWMRDELKRVLTYNKLDFASSEISVESLVELLNMIQSKEITVKAGQRIIEQMPNNEKSPKAIAEELGLLGVVKDDEILAAVKQAIEENPKAVDDYLSGQKASINFLVGQVMRLTRGKADPGETVKLLKENIE